MAQQESVSKYLKPLRFVSLETKHPQEIDEGFLDNESNIWQNISTSNSHVMHSPPNRTRLNRFQAVLERERGRSIPPPGGILQQVNLLLSFQGCRAFECQWKIWLGLMGRETWITCGFRYISTQA